MLLKHLHTSGKAEGSQAYFFLHKSFAGFRTWSFFTHWFLIAAIGSKQKNWIQQITTCTNAR